MDDLELLDRHEEMTSLYAPHATAGGGLLLNYIYRNLQDKLKSKNSKELNTHN